MQKACCRKPLYLTLSLIQKLMLPKMVYIFSQFIFNSNKENGIFM